MWKQKRLPPKRLLAVPDGSVARDDSGRSYYFVGGKALSISSDDIFLSWSFPSVFEVPDAISSTFVDGGKLGYRPGTVRFNLGDGCMYYFSPRERHKITGTQFLRELGIRPAHIKYASQSDVELHKEGSEIF